MWPDLGHVLCVNGSFLDIKNYNYSHILRKKLLIPVMIHERYQYVRKLKLGLFIVLFSPLFCLDLSSLKFSNTHQDYNE